MNDRLPDAQWHGLVAPLLHLLLSCPYGTFTVSGALDSGSAMTVEEKALSGRTFTAVTGPWSRRDARQLKLSKTEELWLNYAHGFHEPTLDLLADLPPTITRLHVIARWVTDLEPIYALGDRLRSLNLTTAAGTALDLTKLPQLTKIAAEWQQVEATIASAVQLQDVYVGHYQETDLTPLAVLSSLQRLTMKDLPSIKSLNGLENLTALTDLTIVLARYLSDIDELAGVVGSQLTSRNLDTCRRISDLAPIAHCTALTFLNLGNIGDVPSAGPLAALQQLVRLYLYESTRFEDGDLSPLLRLHRLEDLRLMNRRHYRPSVNEIEAALKAEHS